ncbi:MAG: type I-E CRISPR-associated protein Cse1/CasA, partial [Rhodococcus sp.]|nr:type I-E CRISPR-associated protein Cse1/CasA [Rhodococcus sp. (in: high G+C Gram-positive bacteria)]
LVDGGHAELPLSEVLARAHEVREIVGEIPTQTFALTRLLLAICYRALDNAEDPVAEQWRALWQMSELPADAFDDYLDAFSHRFDLLHPETPFFQVAGLSTAKGELGGLERLIADVPNGHQYFTTRGGRALDRISFAEAARWLVHAHAFDPSGIKSGAVGDDRVKGGKGYPIGTGWCGALGGLLLEGRNLRETLLINMVPHDLHRSVFAADDDLPVWERDPLTAAVERPTDPAPRGPLELLTWQSRRIRLGFDDHGVTAVLIANGDPTAPQNMHRLETMTAWRRSPAQEKARKEALVYMPRTHDPERALWRGLASLLPAHESTGSPSALPSRTIDWISHLTDSAILEPDYFLHTRALGIAYGSQNAVVDELVDDTVDFRVILASERDRRFGALAVDAVAAVEQAVTGVALLAGNLAIAAGGEPDGPRDRAREIAYFRLSSPFRHWLSSLDTHTDLDDVRNHWFDTARSIVGSVARDLVDHAGPQAWIGRTSQTGQHVSTPEAYAWFRHALVRALPYPNSRISA